MFSFSWTSSLKQSVMDNIRIGDQRATDEQVIAAAKAAQCHAFVEEGTHDELLGKKGLYERLYTIQNESLGWSI